MRADSREVNADLDYFERVLRTGVPLDTDTVRGLIAEVRRLRARILAEAQAAIDRLAGPPPVVTGWQDEPATDQDAALAILREKAKR